MPQQQHGTERKENRFKTDFGAFYPTGYIVVAFKEYDDAKQVCEGLRADGYEKKDCDLYTAGEVAEATQQNLKDTGLMARLGKSTAAIKEHHKVAQDGATFLLVHAPRNADTERVMNAVRRRPFVLAHRYHHLAIEDLEGGSGSNTIRTTSAR